MQRLSGLLLVLAGASLGVYTYLPAPRDGAEKLAEMTRISAAPDRDARSLSQSADGITNVPRLAGGGAASVTSAATGAGAGQQGSSAAPSGGTVGTWSTVVTADAGNKLSSSKPGDAETRAELTRDLQRELTRVGCYGGEINGAWTASTKRAMSNFMDRVNASLPASEPDYILLTLVQGHAAAACGAECPAGQVASGEGRCVPQAVVAQAQKKSQRDETRRVAEERNAAAEQARIADADRRANEQRQRAAAAKADVQKVEVQKRQAVAAASPEVLPWLQDNATADVRVPGSRREPPPGMMSIGGPDPESLVTGSKPITAPAPSIVAPQVVPQPKPRLALADPASDTDLSPAAPELKAPKPQPAERPYYAPAPRAASPGLPGTKSGVSVRRMKPARKSVVQRSDTPWTPRKVTAVRRPPPVVKVMRPKVKYFASASKSARGQPRPGTARYNLMQALGGIY